VFVCAADGAEGEDVGRAEHGGDLRGDEFADGAFAVFEGEWTGGGGRGVGVEALFAEGVAEGVVFRGVGQAVDKTDARVAGVFQLGDGFVDAGVLVDADEAGGFGEIPVMIGDDDDGDGFEALEECEGTAAGVGDEDDAVESATSGGALQAEGGLGGFLGELEIGRVVAGGGGLGDLLGELHVVVVENRGGAEAVVNRDDIGALGVEALGVDVGRVTVLGGEGEDALAGLFLDASATGKST